MNIHPDFEDLLRLLEEHGVEYMIVGGYAVAYHGHPRFTKDIDVFFQLSEDNVGRLRQALIAFGFREEDLPLEAFMTVGNVLTFGVVPARVDLINEIDGVSFDEAFAERVRSTYGKVSVNFIGLKQLIKNKLASGRPQDEVDARQLGALRRDTSK